MPADIAIDARTKSIVTNQVLLWRHKDCSEDPTTPSLKNFPIDNIWLATGNMVRLRTEILFDQLRSNPYWTKTS